jgi:hypothetical protein
MAIRQRRYSLEEMARRGTEIYEQQLRPRLAAGNKGRYLAIDIETGDFELADTGMDASDRLIARKPDAQIWGLRIGYKAERHFGFPLDAEEA